MRARLVAAAVALPAAVCLLTGPAAAQYCDNLEGQEEKGPVFVTALLFRELATGRVLPFLHLLNDGNPLR